MQVIDTDRHEVRPTVLTLLGAYWPGNDASGPIQSFKAMATALADEFEFRLVARDRAFGAAESLVNPKQVEWTDLGFAKARYCSVGWRGAERLGKLLSETHHDILWLNGFFDREFTIPALMQLKRLGRPRPRATLLSPRGEFGVGAIGLKRLRKRAYIAVTKSLGLLEGVWLHATGEDERRDMSAVLPHAPIVVAPNVRLLGPMPTPAPSGEDIVQLVFLGRIARVKNLDFALRSLQRVRSRIRFDIYGPAQDVEYWRECQGMIAGLPPHVVVTHKGEIPNDTVPVALAAYDLLLLPTRGENFGHAIFEALSCGVPVLISDTTPWRDLTADNAGWDLPLYDPHRFAEVIDTIAGMPIFERERLRRGARERAERWVRQSDAVARTCQMLRVVLADRKTHERSSATA